MANPILSYSMLPTFVVYPSDLALDSGWLDF